MKGLSTKILNVPFQKRDPHGAVHIPVYDSASFEFETAEEINSAFEGKIERHTYSRISNPTVGYFEKRVQVTTGGQNALALSSGMAAISNTVLTVAGAGDNLICSKYIFGNTYSLFKNTLSRLNITAKFVDPENYDEIYSAIDEKTRMIFMESITNPQLIVPDFHKISDIAKKKSILFAADTTATPPGIFEAKRFGVDVEIISSTKLISGGGTSVGGVIVDYGTYNWEKNPYLKDDFKKFGKFSFIRRLRGEVYRNLGACLSPHNAYLQNLGLETLHLRIKYACENALALARYLSKKNVVKNVRYPGLETSESFEVAQRMFPVNKGAILTFELPDKDTCFKFMNSLKIIRCSTNIHDNRTLIIHPSSTIFCEFTPGEKLKLGVTDRMLRLAAGIEDAEDLINDIKSAINLLEE